METPNQKIKKAKTILDDFSIAILNLKNVLDDQYCQAIDAIVNCKGKIVTTGMGKAGIVMRKFTASLCSLGTPSCYLHPGEASHGDLGVMGEDDILFVASTSGKTREVIEVIDLSREINKQPIIGLTSHPDSLIREKANIIIDMGDFEEAGELKLAPTTSILIMQALTDTIALIVAHEKGFSKENFGKFHHSGYLGALARNDGQIY
jgi:arabinose-5-phosphate isomerase